jgi:hypothetical protein
MGWIDLLRTVFSMPSEVRGGSRANKTVWLESGRGTVRKRNRDVVTKVRETRKSVTVPYTNSSLAHNMYKVPHIFSFIPPQNNSNMQQLLLFQFCQYAN